VFVFAALKGCEDKDIIIFYMILGPSLAEQIYTDILHLSCLLAL
jgi:hypothetical protein